MKIISILCLVLLAGYFGHLELQNHAWEEFKKKQNCFVLLNVPTPTGIKQGYGCTTAIFIFDKP